jgi:hypothetical protein
MSVTKISQSLATLLAMCAVAISGPSAHATILITEINSNGTGGDFFEIYNSGASAVDLTGWRWSDYDVRNWASAQSFDAITLNAGEVAVVGVGNNSTPPTPLFGSAAANTAFRTSWGLSGSVKMPTWTGTGGGLGSGDGVILFNAAGNVANSLIYRIAPLVSATTQDLSTVSLSTFTKSFEPQPTANGHAGVMGGGTGTESLVWDPTSPVGSPTYRNAVVGQFAAFANPNSSATIGSPGIVPEPSTIAMAVLGGALAIGHAAQRRFGRRDARKHTTGA